MAAAADVATTTGIVASRGGAAPGLHPGVVVAASAEAGAAAVGVAAAGMSKKGIGEEKWEGIGESG
jgi:hypothetical protein